MEKLKGDNAVCLCANCYGMTESLHLKKSTKEIVEKSEIYELEAFFKRLDRNIKKFSFPNLFEE